MRRLRSATKRRCARSADEPRHIRLDADRWARWSQVIEPARRRHGISSTVRSRGKLMAAGRSTLDPAAHQVERRRPSGRLLRPQRPSRRALRHRLPSDSSAAATAWLIKTTSLAEAGAKSRSGRRGGRRRERRRSLLEISFPSLVNEGSVLCTVTRRADVAAEVKFGAHRVEVDHLVDRVAVDDLAHT